MNDGPLLMLLRFFCVSVVSQSALMLQHPVDTLILYNYPSSSFHCTAIANAPDKHPELSHQYTMAHLLGFPPGYFVIRSVATGRLWDVSSDEVEDGTPVILWPEKERSLVESG